MNRVQLSMMVSQKILNVSQKNKWQRVKKALQVKYYDDCVQEEQHLILAGLAAPRRALRHSQGLIVDVWNRLYSTGCLLRVLVSVEAGQ